MLKTLGTIVLYAIAVALIVALTAVAYRMAIAVLEGTRLEDRGKQWGQRLAEKKAQFEDQLEDKLELV